MKLSTFLLHQKNLCWATKPTKLAHRKESLTIQFYQEKKTDFKHTEKPTVRPGLEHQNLRV